MKQTEKNMKTNNFSKNTNQISIMENLRIGSIVKAIDGEKGMIVDIIESFVVIKLDQSFIKKSNSNKFHWLDELKLSHKSKLTLIK
jgi:preprotein translocase subunit YajC